VVGVIEIDVDSELFEYLEGDLWVEAVGEVDSPFAEYLRIDG
jgi:hypothetical protein